MAANISFYLFAFFVANAFYSIYIQILTVLLKKPGFILNTTAVIRTITDSMAAAVGKK